ncbi:MAG TPA: 50S ribosomal protein L19 [Planctomycetes bacterium]|nr:50S ribosomal protein L19 [Planctomycetota bacterium]
MDNFSDLEQQWLKPKIPDFSIGDTVDVKVKIREGGKERIQVFQGTVISRRGRGPAESIIVRRIVQGEGVERVFPLHAPTIEDITVVRRGDVRRAKLYYLRDRVGRATRVKEKLDTKRGRKS